MSDEKIPEWAIQVAIRFDGSFDKNGDTDRLARLVAKTRADALRQAYACADFHGDMEVMAEIEEMIERGPL